jgi:hypothetical protein
VKSSYLLGEDKKGLKTASASVKSSSRGQSSNAWMQSLNVSTIHASARFEKGSRRSRDSFCHFLPSPALLRSLESQSSAACQAMACISKHTIQMKTRIVV